MAPVVGIDLGTTFSCVAVYQSGKAEVIPNENGDRLLPSAVYFNPSNSGVVVGEDARKESVKCADNFFSDIKRILGRSFEESQKIISLMDPPPKYVPIQIENDLKFEIKHEGSKDGTKLISPSEISAEVLKYMKLYASAYLDKEVAEAVISIPANFTSSQRRATKKAAELAGLKVLKLITEPIAAAIHYSYNKPKRDNIILIFDFGGGTLDVSIIKVTKDAFRVLAVAGDQYLGGRDLDKSIFRFITNEIDKRDTDLLSERLIRRLEKKCIKLKEKLSNKSNAVIKIDIPEKKELESAINRDQFNSFNTDIFNRVVDVVRKCIDSSEIYKSEIDEVIMVGGSSRVPKIEELLQEFFEGKKPKRNLNPDEAVALGAAIFAESLKGDSENLRIFQIFEVTPISLGVKKEGDLMQILIQKNTQIPCTVTERYKTVINNQRSVKVEIYEGERKMCKFNNFLGELIVRGLPKKRAGDVWIEVTFDLDKNGILQVTAAEESQLGVYKLELKNSIIGIVAPQLTVLSENEKSDDITFEEFTKEKNKKNMIIRRITYDLDKITDPDDKIFIKKKCSKFEEHVSGLHHTQLQELCKNFDSFEKIIAPILERYHMNH